VGEDLGGRAEDLGELVGLGVEVGDQELDAAAGLELVDLADCLRVEPGAAVGEVVAGHAGDRGVLQAHRGD
jgi:hypothetical protein